MRVYLDNCCFNRPFDNQSNIKVNLESLAKLFVQENIINKNLELVWSYILDYENSFNPFLERKIIINNWKSKAILDISENDLILETAKIIQKMGLKSKDSLHVACAIEGECQYFLTTDNGILKKLKDFGRITVINPVNFVNFI